jgi:8-oxo-dGTP pyrophosphatase MutT (NUDIX family)
MDRAILIEDESTNKVLSERAEHDLIECMVSLESGPDIEVRVADVEAFLDQLLSRIALIKAGGGYVLDPRGRLLMIYRRGFWDLPKGKLEPNEEIAQCAIREVEEECGISGLTIESKAFSTYHLYQEDVQTVLKESVWFRMNTSYDGALSPQEEEDISEVKWVNLPLPNTMKNACYASIREVLEHFNSEGS